MPASDFNDDLFGLVDILFQVVINAPLNQCKDLLSFFKPFFLYVQEKYKVSNRIIHPLSGENARRHEKNMQTEKGPKPGLKTGTFLGSSANHLPL